jgi:antitoxin HicB
MKNKHLGSSLQNFLKEENLMQKISARNTKRTFVYELKKQIKRLSKNKNSFRKIFKSPSTAERIFNDHTGVSLDTLSKAASIVDCNLQITLVPRHKTKKTGTG